MTLVEFYTALIDGKKLASKYFTPGEYIQVYDGMIRDENGEALDGDILPWSDEMAGEFFVFKENKKLRKALFIAGSGDVHETYVYLRDLEHFKSLFVGDFMSWVEPGIEI